MTINEEAPLTVSTEEVKDTSSMVLISQKDWSSFFEELSHESDRAAAILVVAWIDSLLRKKLQATYSKGNAQTREKLFEGNGAFATFSAKVDAAFCAGWIGVDLHHDLHVLRRIRNLFAHEIHGLSIKSDRMKSAVNSIRTPGRQFYDWGQLKASASADGSTLTFFTDDSSGGANDEPLDLTKFIFRMAASWVIAFLAAHLDVGIVQPEDT
jgi:hypothetical protein